MKVTVEPRRLPRRAKTTPSSGNEVMVQNTAASGSQRGKRRGSGQERQGAITPCLISESLESQIPTGKQNTGATETPEAAYHKKAGEPRAWHGRRYLESQHLEAEEG